MTPLFELNCFDVALRQVLFAGYARIKNVEFYRTGQEGWTDFYDPRYSIAFLNTGRVSPNFPSYVKDCSFHHGFSPAIGVFGTDNLVMENNVIHHTVGAGMFQYYCDNIECYFRL